jgi:hypothetical protein
MRRENACHWNLAWSVYREKKKGWEAGGPIWEGNSPPELIMDDGALYWRQRPRPETGRLFVTPLAAMGLLDWETAD